MKQKIISNLLKPRKEITLITIGAVSMLCLLLPLQRMGKSSSKATLHALDKQEANANTAFLHTLENSDSSSVKAIATNVHLAEMQRIAKERAKLRR